jgi:monovalent cation/hydrogen antiporter
LVGFQLKGILGRINGRTVVEYAVIGAAVCATTIVARIAWVSVTAALSRWTRRPAQGTQRDNVALSPRAATGGAA